MPSPPSKKYIRPLPTPKGRKKSDRGRGKRRGGGNNSFVPPPEEFFPPNIEQAVPQFLDDTSVIGDPDEIFSEMVEECQEATSDGETSEKKYEGAAAVTRFHHVVKSFQKLVLYETRAVS